MTEHTSGLWKDILLVEDNPGDVTLMNYAIGKLGITSRCHHVSDGDQAIRFLRQLAPFADMPKPGLILLDLNLPRLSGRQVLEVIRSDASLAKIPVFLLSSSEFFEDVDGLMTRHATGYFTKPTRFKEYEEIFKKIIRDLDENTEITTGHEAKQS